MSCPLRAEQDGVGGAASNLTGPQGVGAATCCQVREGDGTCLQSSLTLCLCSYHCNVCKKHKFPSVGSLGMELPCSCGSTLRAVPAEMHGSGSDGSPQEGWAAGWIPLSSFLEESPVTEWRCHSRPGQLHLCGWARHHAHCECVEGVERVGHLGPPGRTHGLEP